MTTNNTHLFKKQFLKKQLPMYIKMASSLSLVVGAMGIATPVFAQEKAAAEQTEEVIVTGQRKSIESAQLIKQNSDRIVDSIVADDIGKLPDRSITEALQRVPGITIDHFMSLGDPEHFSAEGSGVAVRGMTQVRSELNGRDSFTANGGRNLSFEDVPAELMAGVDVYKNPTADMIEGGIGGTVNLRTRMPFDSDERVIGLSLGANYGDFIEETKPSYSALYSDRWDTEIGEIGFLVDVAYSELSTRTDGMFTRPFFPRDDAAGQAGNTVWVPRGADWRSMEFDRERTGSYAALQWAPNEDVEVSFTVFNSEYTMGWDEDAIFVSNDPYGVIPAADAVYDENDVFVSGRLTANGGIPMGADVRASTRTSETTDYDLGVKWTPDDNWEFDADLQYTKANTNSLDSTVATGVNVPFIDVDLSGDHPEITSDAAFLSNPENYYFGFTMDHQDDNEADQYAFAGNAKYLVEDSIITSVKTGIRYTDRSAHNVDTGYNWVAIYQTWMQGWQIPSGAMPSVEDTSQLHLNTFDNFFKGDTAQPAGVYAPVVDLALNYPNSYQQLHDSAEYLCCYNGYTPTDMTKDQYQNIQSETTAAAYFLTSFAFEDMARPVDGNFGVRLVQTDSVSSGHRIYPTLAPFGNGESEPIDEQNSYTNILPSLNLRWKLREDLFARFAVGKAMTRPAFNQMAAYQILSAGVKDGITVPPGTLPTEDQVNFTSSSNSNPLLKPMVADQLDLSLEWYFNEHGGMVHVNAFSKNIEDFVRDQVVLETYGDHTYTVTRPVNTGSADIDGFEIGYKQFFDFLPAPFDGFGVETNYTYIDSSTKVSSDVAPTDTDGSEYGTMPYEGLSQDSYNFVAMFEKGDWSARLAYNWRSEFLMSVGANGFNGTDKGITWNLPVYNDDYGQLDGSVAYKITDNVTVSLEANNLTNSETRTIMKQNEAGDHYTSYFVNDARYALTLRANF